MKYLKFKMETKWKSKVVEVILHAKMTSMAHSWRRVHILWGGDSFWEGRSIHHLSFIHQQSPYSSAGLLQSCTINPQTNQQTSWIKSLMAQSEVRLCCLELTISCLFGFIHYFEHHIYILACPMGLNPQSYNAVMNFCFAFAFIIIIQCYILPLWI